MGGAKVGCMNEPPDLKICPKCREVLFMDDKQFHKYFHLRGGDCELQNVPFDWDGKPITYLKEKQ